MRMTGKVALVTGGGTGIGRATALLLASEGARVAVLGLVDDPCRAVADEIGQRGRDAFALVADVTSEPQVEAAIKATLDRFERLDVIFNNAGVGMIAPIEETTKEMWDRTIDTNLKGVFLGCKHAIPVMKRQGGGSIINSASTAALIGLSGRAAYSASKGGVIAMTRTLAIECAPYGIRVNSVSPGATATGMVQRLYEAEIDPAEARRQHAAKQPLGRLSLPEEIARAVLFLASDDSPTVTGTNLVVDGGYSAG